MNQPWVQILQAAAHVFGEAFLHLDVELMHARVHDGGKDGARNAGRAQQLSAFADSLDARISSLTFKTQLSCDTLLYGTPH